MYKKFSFYPNTEKSNHHFHRSNPPLQHLSNNQERERERESGLDKEKSEIKRKTTHHHRLNSNPSNLLEESFDPQTVASLLLGLDSHLAKTWSSLGVKLWRQLEKGLVMEKLKVVITLAERVRSKGRDRGLERWGLWNSSERGEENFFFFF